MTRRMVLGNLGGGVVDLRISRPGVDAMTGDINDRNQISFSMLRDAYGRVAAAGEIFGLQQWVNFSETFAAPPPVVWGTQIDGRFRVGDYVRVPGNSGRYQDGSPYLAVVTTSGICIQNTADFPYWVPGTNKFTFMVVL